MAIQLSPTKDSSAADFRTNGAGGNRGSRHLQRAFLWSTLALTHLGDESPTQSTLFASAPKGHSRAESECPFNIESVISPKTPGQFLGRGESWIKRPRRRLVQHDKNAQP